MVSFRPHPPLSSYPLPASSPSNTGQTKVNQVVEVSQLSNPLNVNPSRHLDLINRGIADFRKYLANNPELEGEKGEIFTRFDFLVDALKKSYQSMVEIRSLRKDQLMPIIDSTYLESEVEGGEKPLPHILLTQFLILQFLAEKKSRTVHEGQLLRLLTHSTDILCLFKIVDSYLPKEHLEKLRPLMIQWIESKIERIPVGGVFGLPGGWCSTEGLDGHFMFYALKRIDESRFEVQRINTHQVDITPPPQACEKQLLTKKNLTSFVSNIVDLSQPKLLQSKIEKVSEKHAVNFLFKLNRSQSPNFLDLPFELQTHAANCGFMAFYLVYLAIYSYPDKFSFTHGQEMQKDPIDAGNVLREEFRSYLHSLLPK